MLNGWELGGPETFLLLTGFDFFLYREINVKENKPTRINRHPDRCCFSSWGNLPYTAGPAALPRGNEGREKKYVYIYIYMYMYVVLVMCER